MLGRTEGAECGLWTDPMDNDVQMRGLVWQSMQLQRGRGEEEKREGWCGVHERLLDQVLPDRDMFPKYIQPRV